MSASNRAWRAVVLAVLLPACFNSGGYVPVIFLVQGVNPPNNGLATGTTTVNVLGDHFDSNDIVFWNGRKQTTTFKGASVSAPSFVSNSQTLQVDLDLEATRAPGTATLTVANGEGLISDAFGLQIFDSPFTVTAVAPQQIPAGSQDTTLTVTGTGFNTSSQVSWNGMALATTFVTSTNMTAVVPAALLVAPGSALLRISENSCPGSGGCFPFSLTSLVSVGSSTTIVIPSGAFDLVWDATHALLFASTISGPTLARAVTAIEPASGTLGVTIPGVANGLSISDQDEFLYVGSGGAPTAPTRYVLPGLTGGTPLSAAGGESVVAAPGAPTTFAFIDRFLQLGVADGTAVRSNTVDTLSTGIFSLTWGFDSSTIFGLGSLSHGLVVYNVDASGVRLSSTLPISTQFVTSAKLGYDRSTRRIYVSSGETFNESGTDPRPFPLGADASSCRVAIDSAATRAYFACIENAFGLTVRSFSQSDQSLLSRVILEPIGTSGPTPTQIVRWGSDGLAVATDVSIYLYKGPFVH